MEVGQDVEEEEEEEEDIGLRRRALRVRWGTLLTTNFCSTTEHDPDAAHLHRPDRHGYLDSVDCAFAMELGCRSLWPR